MRFHLPWRGRRGAAAGRGRSRRSTRRRSRIGRRALLTWGALVLGAAAAMVFLFYFSAAFVVKDVQATGAREEVAESALQHAQIPHGRPLARVSEGRVRERVLEDPRIESVEVERDWPSSVTVAVTEREPAVALRGDGSTWLADDAGVVYEEVEDPSNKLPIISVRTDPTELDAATVTGLAELWRMRPDPDTLEGDLGAPSVGRDGSIEMDLGQVTLLWGPPTDNEKKWNVVTALVGQDTIDPQGALAMTIDVRVPGTPVVSGLPEATG
ncbi:Cell division protein FtsQ [Serinicoccus hydrothermalis]|uniref:Cell division protein FtsQ n=1 Tax=Serinicoccus hydrothermalis TaxID=1758689 RepID=A0A1B1NA05_9MICO|nr:FtsQ-type POTRA domain-containing protein [Serinicoccus hydrothermalis]ANS78272.1 Cell division protein FtsQ [Serinicoccus hydrothermalis]